MDNNDRFNLMVSAVFARADAELATTGFSMLDGWLVRRLSDGVEVSWVVSCGLRGCGEALRFPTLQAVWIARTAGILRHSMLCELVQAGVA